ncbi:ribonuclease-like 3 [Perca flavescens]|uniref:ribonuclease-like 3 n=1 Tax=Perca flavescens TaxID=8167 RepID=UPI00106DD31D|nr:ribonuclease-like 3 [Perca flavescens]
MRIQFVCLLLVLLSATVLSQDAKTKRQYKKFRNQHINEQMSVDGCDDVMRARKIAINNKKCKKTNTFILSNVKRVRSICVNNGEPYDQDKNMTKSHEHFNIVVCRLEPTKHAKCHYNGKKLNKKIIIKCVGGFPVHYDGDIGHCD